MGNNRLIYADLNKNDKIDAGEIIEENNYYPFGLKHQGYNELAGSEPSGYKYKFGGKELQNELGLNIYDFEARGYMPDLGRTTTMDPLAENFTLQSPYSFLNNNPLLFVDPTGMASENYRDCDSCETEEDWNAYYQQAENTADMIGEDAWGFTNTRLTRTMNEDGHSIFYLDGEKMDLRGYNNKAHAAGSLLGDAALVEGSVRFLKYLSSFFKSGGDEAIIKGGFIVDSNKFNYFFGRVTTGNPHNVARSAQNLKDLSTLGIKNENQLMEVFDQAFNNGTTISTKTSQYGTTVTKSVQVGGKGDVNVSFFYQGGNMNTTPSISTIIPKIFKK